MKELMMQIDKNDIDNEGTARLLKGTRGLALFVEQHINNPNSNKDNKVLFANKVMTHEQAIELRDYLISHYPLEK